MNYYGIWISFQDNSNLFYNPYLRQFVKLPEGQSMPAHFFFTMDDHTTHKRIVEEKTHHCYMDRSVTLHLSIIRPEDPDYAPIHEHFNHGVN